MRILHIVVSFMFSVSIIFNSYAAQGWGSLPGFNWYNEKPEPKKKSQEDKDKTQVAAASKNVEDNKNLPDYELNIRDLQARRERAHRRALDQPTFDNLLAELRLEKEMMNKAQIYGERRVAVAKYDSEFSNIKEHHNVLHRSVQDHLDKQETKTNLTKLSQYWGLVLQVQDDCPHCHTFAPIVLEFAKEYGFQLLAASQSGNDFEGIEGARDHGQMLALNPSRETPMLYLIKGDGKEVIPISRGINSDDQIILNIKAIDKHIRRLFDV